MRKNRLCVRCGEWTDQPFYCHDCQRVLKKPRLTLPTIPYHKISFSWR